MCLYCTGLSGKRLQPGAIKHWPQITGCESPTSAQSNSFPPKSHKIPPLPNCPPPSPPSHWNSFWQPVQPPLSLSLPLYLFIYLFIYLSISLSLSLSISLYLSIYLFIHSSPSSFFGVVVCSASFPRRPNIPAHSKRDFLLLLSAWVFLSESPSVRCSVFFWHPSG